MTIAGYLAQIATLANQSLAVEKDIRVLEVQLSGELRELVRFTERSLHTQQQILTEVKAIRQLLTPSPAISTKLVLGTPEHQ